MMGDNAPPLDGWALPVRYHCGQMHDSPERECGVCGLDVILHPQAAPVIEPDAVLGEN